LIEDLVVTGSVDPDRVYLIGYSAGGDGVFQLAPRISDRLAGAGMFAGHPNETRAEGLRNVAFALHVGAEDGAYDRNRVGRTWAENLARLHASDPGGYEFQAEIHSGKGHWMDGEEKVALPWLARHVREPRPERIVWIQDDVTHRRSYWLATDDPRPRAEVIVERRGQEIRIVEWNRFPSLTVRLDDEMFDLDAPIVIRVAGEELFRGLVPRTIRTIARTLEERGDPRAIFRAEVTVELPSHEPAPPPEGG